jgi:ribonuclease HII
VAGGRVKTTTSIAKEGCTPFTIESDAKNITNAAIIFTKTSPEELYQNYPQAIPNFQSRDSLISAVAQIKNDFVASAGSGNYYNYNRGFGSFAVVIAGRSSGCTGSVGNVLVGYGATCEIGIYWIYNNIYKLVDTVSTVGGQSEAAKQQAAMKVQATALSQAILRALDAVTPIMDQVNALNDKYSSNWNTAGQPAIDQYMSLYSQLNSLLATVVTTRDQANTILNSQYVNSEISQIAQNVMSLSSKFTGSFQSWMNQIKSSIANINSGLNQPSADASSAIVKAKSLLAAAARDQAVAQAKYQELMDQYSRKIWNGWSESSFLNTINDLDRMMSGYSNSISNSQSMLNQSVVAMKNARTQADVDAWNGAVNLYQQLSNIYNSSLGLLGKVSSLLKSQMKSGSTPESDAALQNADTFYKSALNALNDANSELNSYPIFLKSKGILTSGNTIYNQEITRLKNIIYKYNSATQEANALLAKSNYSLSVSGGLGSWAKVADLYRQSQSNFSTATNYYSKMLSIISSQNPSMTGDQSVDPFVDTNGVDEVTAGSISTKKDKQGRYLITVTSNQEDTDFIILAVKSGSKAIKFVATSDADGNIYLRTTRKLAGYVLQLMLDNEVISKTKKLA